jgi:hypothetical protein
MKIETEDQFNSRNKITRSKHLATLARTCALLWVVMAFGSCKFEDSATDLLQLTDGSSNAQETTNSTPTSISPEIKFHSEEVDKAFQKLQHAIDFMETVGSPVSDAADVIFADSDQILWEESHNIWIASKDATPNFYQREEIIDVYTPALGSFAPSGRKIVIFSELFNKDNLSVEEAGFRLYKAYVLRQSIELVIANNPELQSFTEIKAKADAIAWQEAKNQYLMWSSRTGTKFGQFEEMVNEFIACQKTNDPSECWYQYHLNRQLT